MSGVTSMSSPNTRRWSRTTFSSASRSAIAGRVRLRSAGLPSTASNDERGLEAPHYVFTKAIAEADEFYDAIIPASLAREERNVVRQAFAGLLWSKQFYHYIVRDWLNGDPAYPPP